MNNIMKKPLLVGARKGAQTSYKSIGDLTIKFIKQRYFSRDKLPSASKYYRQEFPQLKSSPKSDWVNVRCCFHDDRYPSLSINLNFGGFRCFACGVYDGDIIAFHMKRYGLSFIQTVNYFGAWGNA